MYQKKSLCLITRSIQKMLSEIFIFIDTIRKSQNKNSIYYEFTPSLDIIERNVSKSLVHNQAFFKQRTHNLKNIIVGHIEIVQNLSYCLLIQLCIGGSCYAQKHNGIAISLETWLGRLKHRINIISRVTTYIHLHIHDLGLKSSSKNKCFT